MCQCPMQSPSQRNRPCQPFSLNKAIQLEYPKRFDRFVFAALYASSHSTRISTRGTSRIVTNVAGALIISLTKKRILMRGRGLSISGFTHSRSFIVPPISATILIQNPRRRFWKMEGIIRFWSLLFLFGRGTLWTTKVMSSR